MSFICAKRPLTSAPENASRMQDIADLRDFYQSPLGLSAGRLLAARLSSWWPTVRGEQIAALGYALPFLEALSQADVYAFMPAALGAVRCPAQGLNRSCLVSMANLPLGDGSIDRVVALHALEWLVDPQSFLGETRRILKGNGRLLLIVPNRKGLWARNDRTPFGCGQPYSMAQMRKLLKEQGFNIERMRAALFAPPCAMRLKSAFAEKTENMASRLLPFFGGVLMVEASKQICAPAGLRTRKNLSPIVLPAALPASCYAAS